MTDEKPKAEGMCLDMEFHLDSQWRFFVPDLDRTFKTYEDMRDAIERSYKTVVKAKRAKLAISAVDREGKKFAVTGVHAGHGKPITSPARERYALGDLYFETPLVVAALAEKRRINHDLARVNALLDNHKIEHRGYRTFEASMHEGEIRRIEKAHAAAQKIADKPLMEALAGIQVDEIEFD